MDFEWLDLELDLFTDKLNQLNLLNCDKINTPYFLTILNSSNYMLTLHDVEYYRPLMINDKMKNFYGFKKNYLRGINYLFYLKTIHISTYNSLLSSISFFRKDHLEKLHLNYMLLRKDKEWKPVIGSTKTILRNKYGKPKYALTLAVENEHTNNNIYKLKTSLLTNKEKQIVEFYRKGLSKSKISENLNISEHTIHSHLKNIYKKLGISKITELFALNNQILKNKVKGKEKLNSLSKRELQVAELLVIGLTKKEISLCLNISELTVHTHTKNIYRKLKISRISELINLDTYN
ncbi:helix-turn-helix transcriptional regulator [Wenyingzhuangia sp. IMCC45533]